MPNTYTTEKIRNISFIGHGSTGKTSLTEMCLAAAKTIPQPGDVEKGNTVSDFTEEEIERKVSLRTTLCSLEYNEHKINILDVPGAGDFIGELYAALNSSESALVFVDAENGIEIETENCWRVANSFELPRFVILNKMDKERADFKKTIDQLQQTMSPNIMPIQIPIGEGDNFKGVIDVLGGKAYIYEGPDKFKVADIPADKTDEYKEARDNLLNVVAEADDAIMEKFLEEEEVSQEEMIKCLKLSIENQSVYPVICGSATKQIGIKQIIDSIINNAPIYKEGKELTVYEDGQEDKESKITAKPTDPPLALIFKTMIDQYAGKYSFLKVMSGEIAAGADLYNIQKQSKEKIAHIYTLVGKKQIEIDKACMGDIAVLAKVESAKTNDTFCSPDKNVSLAPIKFPSATYYVAIKAKNKNDEEKINSALFKVQEEDPTFRVRYDQETRETVVEAMGDMQTEVVFAAKLGKSRLEYVKSIPRVAYRETIKSKVETQYRHKKQTGGHGQFGEVLISVEPGERGTGFVFEEKIFGGAIPKTYIPGVEKGVRESLQEGTLAKYPVVDIKVTLLDGSYHEVDSSEMSFKIAGSQATRKALADAKPVLLEPVMEVQIFVPEDLMGDIMNDLNAKRGRVLGMEQAGSMQRINAQVPLAEMLSYSIDLKSITSGKGTFQMKFAFYQEFTGRLAEKVIADRQKEEEEES
jgi:elongation factor G